MSYFEVGSANWRILYEAITFCAAGIGILSVWAVLSWRHWFARGAVLAIAIAALLPIRAYEPVVLFLVAAPLTIMALAVIRHYNGFAVIHKSSIEDKRKTGFQVVGFTCAVIGVDLTLAHFGSKTGWDPGSARPSWYEWVAFGSLVIAPGAALAILRRIELSEEDRQLARTTSAATSARFRFGMLDLFLGMIIVGIASGIVGAIWRSQLIMDWLGMFASAACLTLIIVTAACFVLLRTRWIALKLLVIAIAASTALHTWVFPDWTGAEVFIAGWSKDWLPIFKIFLFSFSLLAVTTVIATYLLWVAGSFAESIEHRSGTDRVELTELVESWGILQYSQHDFARFHTRSRSRRLIFIRDGFFQGA